MQNILYALIVLFGTVSYAVGIWKMLYNKYTPSVFSRVVWLLLAINSFAGVVMSHGSKASILLAAILLAGNAAMCVTSFWKGTRSFGSLEYICLMLLTLSGVAWVLLDAPLINLSISLFAHLIGAMPTYRSVWEKPESESSAYWSLFFIASVLSIFASEWQTLSAIVFPIYYTLFDGSLFVLSLRGRLKQDANTRQRANSSHISLP
jgi:hypothetical protein